MEPVVRALVDERRPSWDGDGPRPVRVYLRPAVTGEAAVVLLSHGTGGSAWQLTWVAEALARAGFLAVAVDHHGNNAVDGYLPEGFAFWWERALDLSFVLDVLSTERELGPVGVLGFSLGGYTVLALAGARIDSGVYGQLLAGSLDLPPPPEFPDLAEALEARLEAGTGEEVAAAGASYRDARVGAAFAICPALAGLVEVASLRAVEVPVAVRWAGADEICPDASRYADLVPGADGRCVGSDVGHYAFLHSTEGAEPVRDAVAADAVSFFRQAFPAGERTVS